MVICNILNIHLLPIKTSREYWVELVISPEYFEVPVHLRRILWKSAGFYQISEIRTKDLTKDQLIMTIKEYMEFKIIASKI
jgi:hypothetical protein